MARGNKETRDAANMEKERREHELRRKPLDSEVTELAEPTGSLAGGTSRQRTIAAKKSVQQARKGKSIAPPPAEESDDESGGDEAPQKKAKMSKGKGIAVERDREKTPTQEELYDHLMNGIGWMSTRFADLELLKELGLDADVKAMVGHLKMPNLLTMAYPFYKDASAQFLATLEVVYHDERHVRQGWGIIRFKIEGKQYNMSFKKIGEAMGFQDAEDPTLPRCEDLPKNLWKLLSGNVHRSGADKNSCIRHPSVRYLHRMLVHAFYSKKQAGTVTEEDLRLITPAIRPYDTSNVLKLPSEDVYATFGMVGFFVSRLAHYKSWAWTTTDGKAKIGIGNLITPLLEFMGAPLGKETSGPKFIDGAYLKIATYFSGRYGREYVYQYTLRGRPVRVLLPNKELTTLERPGIISFNIPSQAYFTDHGPLDPMGASSSTRGYPVRQEDHEDDTSEQVYGPPRYYFEPFAGVLPHGALRDAHEHIDKLQRWNKGQDRAYFKLKTKYSELKRKVKSQAKASAKMMKKVIDVLVRGGVAGCSSSDFIVGNTSAPQPRTDRQNKHAQRNFEAPKSASGNLSPSFSSSDDDSGDVADSTPMDYTAATYSHFNPAYNAPQPQYYITFPDEGMSDDNATNPDN